MGFSGYMTLLVDLTKREFKLRYLGSLLGSYWNVLHPLMMIFIYTVIFSQVMRAKLGVDSGKFSYSLYLCSGLLAWNFFTEVINRGATALVDNAPFLKKIAFPPVILFGASAASAAINFVISFAIFFIALQVLQPVGILNLSGFLACVILYALFGIGIAVALGCLNVFLRDFQQVMSIVLQLWFWFTPIVYPFESLPEFARKALMFNPAFPFIRSFHNLLYFQKPVESQDLLIMTGWVVISLGVAAFIYRKSISLARDLL